MNRQELRGYVKFLELKQGFNEKTQREWMTWKFVLNSTNKNGSWNSLPCETWNRNLGNALQEGMYIELIDYLPTNKSYTDKNGQKKSWFSIDIQAVRAQLENGSWSADIGHNQPVAVNANEVAIQPQPQQPQPQKFNVEKAKEIVENITTNEVEEDEEVTDLDWMREVDNMKSEKTTPQPQPQQTQTTHIPFKSFNFAPSASDDKIDMFMKRAIDMVGAIHVSYEDLGERKVVGVQCNDTQANVLQMIRDKMETIEQPKPTPPTPNPNSTINPQRMVEINQKLQSSIKPQETVVADLSSKNENWENNEW